MVLILVKANFATEVIEYQEFGVQHIKEFSAELLSAIRIQLPKVRKLFSEAFR